MKENELRKNIDMCVEPKSVNAQIELGFNCDT